MILLSPFLFTHWLSMTSLLVLGGEEGAAKSGEWELWGEEEQSQARGLPNLCQVRGGFQGLVVQGREDRWRVGRCGGSDLYYIQKQWTCEATTPPVWLEKLPQTLLAPVRVTSLRQ